MAQAGFTPISLYYSTTASAVPTAGNLVAGELALNTNDGKLYYKNSSNVVTLLASTSGASGDVVGPASATANGVALFDGTTGKLLQSPSTITYASSTLTLPSISASGNLAFTGTGNRITGDFTNATLANRVMFQTSTANSTSNISVLPSGTGTSTQLNLYGASDPDNANRARLAINNSAFNIVSDITGTGTYVPIAMYTGGSERLRIDTSGNVGIGTSSPTSKLHVVGGRTDLTANSETYALGVRYGAGTGIYYIGATNSATPDMVFSQVGGSERMRITNAGDVGIGVTPASNYGPLQVYTSTNGTAASFGNGAFVHAFNSVAYFSSNSTLSAAGAWTARATSAASVAPGTGTIQFFTDSGLTNGSAFTPTERMRIDSSGNVGIGTNGPAAKLDVRGSSTFLVNATNPTAWISVDSALTTGSMYNQWNTTSSIGITGTYTSHPYALYTNNTERMRINSNGSVGIGTTTSANNLLTLGNVSGVTTANLVTLQGANNISNNLGNCIEWGHSNGAGYRSTFGAFVGTGAPFIGLCCEAGTNSNTFRTRGLVGTLIYNDTGGATVFSTVTNANADNQTATERLRIDSSGNALFAKAVRATITTDNDLSFDMNAASNFKCTPTAGGALTFTNITSGQTGNIILVNNSNYAITAAATTKVSSTCLATISATGTYWLSYYSDGTNVYVANTGALA